MERNKKAHNALLRQYIKEIENPDRHGFIGGKWVQSPYKGDDPNNRGYGIDILQNKAAAKLTQGRPGKWLSEAEEKMLRDKHINDVNRITKDHFFPYLRRTPLTQEKEIMATGLLYRGDHINGTKLAYPYYNGSNADFQKAVEDYYISKNLNDRAWRSKKFIDAHKATNATTPISLESPYVPMEYIGYHPDEDYYYAGELPQVDTFGEHSHADGGMLYGNQEAMPSAPQEYYQQGETDNSQESPKQWDDLLLAEKNAFIATAVKHGITNMEDIRKAYDELAQGNMNDYALQDNMNEETSPYNDDGSSIDQDSANVFLKGGYKPSRYIKSFISHMEGSSMKTNRSFDAEARDFWDAIPQDIRKKITQQQADALYSYSYNVGAGNFKKRVIPALQNYFNGTGSIDKVQRSMWASKDNQLRGLANRRAQERAMFAGSEVPVYYNEYNNDTPTPQYSNAWRDSRLGPVTSINMSRGLGVVDNNAMRGSVMLGPVSNRQDNSMMKEAINTLYDDSAQPAISPVTQEQESSLDRYNEIQDYLSSMSPFSFSNGGRMYADGGVTSTNGIYHVNPSNYENILNTIANDKPVEVTMPDTTVTAADPSNYRSYYDPNGAGDFLDASTLGLFPNPFNLTKSASTFMQHPTLSSAWNTTKDALMFAGSAGKEVAFAPLGLMNLIDKDGVRKTYGLAKDGNYAGAVMSGLGDVLNAGMVTMPIARLRTYKDINPIYLETGKKSAMSYADTVYDKIKRDWPLKGETKIPSDIKRDASKRYSDFIESQDYLDRLKYAGLEDHWDYMKNLTDRRVKNIDYFPGNVRQIVANDIDALGASRVEPTSVDYGITLQEDLRPNEIFSVINHEIAHYATGNASINDITNMTRYPFRYDPEVNKIGDIMRYDEDIAPNIPWKEKYNKMIRNGESIEEATKAREEYDYLTIPQEKRARAYSLYEQAKAEGVSTDEFVDKYTKNGSIISDSPMELRQMGKILTPANIKKYLKNFLSVTSPIVIGYSLKNNDNNYGK